MTTNEFRLPDPGEGLTEAEIVSWRVQVGDTVAVNDIVVEIETAKSLVELPIPFAGVVSALLAAEGETVQVGAPIITVETVGAPEAAPDPVSAADGPAGTDRADIGPDLDDLGETDRGHSDPEVGGPGGSTPPTQTPLPPRHPKGTGRQAVLVGYGAKPTSGVRRPRHARPAPVGGPSGGPRALAKPSVRKMARDLGVELSSVAGSGPGGVVTPADVEALAAATAGGSQPVATAESTIGSSALPPSGGSEPSETREPIRGVAKAMAQAMVASAFTAPHVTEWVTVDATATMDLVARLRDDPEFRDLRVGPMLVVAKALLLAVRRTPIVNSTWDDASQEIVRHHGVNLGIAAATPRGLVVPNVKGADRMPLPQLARRIAELAETAREGRVQPADTTGGTITLTNIGVFGVDTGTPIINPGESAIVVLGAVRRQPWVVTGPDGRERIEPRHVTTLGVSFDHRHIDGASGSRFLADIAAVVHDPARALVWC